MEGLDLLIKWLHVTSASILVGVLLLVVVGLLPALAGVPDVGSLGDVVIQSARKWIHGSLGVLLLTGAYNFWRALEHDPLRASGQYQGILGTKTLLFFVAFALATVGLRRKLPAPNRGQLTFCLGLAILIILLSAYLNIMRVQLLGAH